MPCWLRVPIMIDSMMGGVTGTADFQVTSRLAPVPPVASDSGMTKRVVARGGRWIASGANRFSNFPSESWYSADQTRSGW